MIILTNKYDVAKSFTIIKDLNEALYEKLKQKINERISNNSSCSITRDEGGSKRKSKKMRKTRRVRRRRTNKNKK